MQALSQLSYTPEKLKTNYSFLYKKSKAHFSGAPEARQSGWAAPPSITLGFCHIGRNLLRTALT